MDDAPDNPPTASRHRAALGRTEAVGGYPHHPGQTVVGRSAPP
jgi:hypothetical protein